MRQPQPGPRRHRAAGLAAEWWWRIGMLALFGLAAAWRWAYLARLQRTPFADSLLADARIYWAWSECILRHGPLPPSPFFLAPLYPYALAAWRAAGAEGVGGILAVQVILGAMAVVLLADATARLAGRGTALVVGVILALFQPSTFFDGLVLPESLLFCLGSLVVWQVVRTDWSRAGTATFGGYGLLIGVLAQGRASHAVLLALVLPLARARPPGRVRLKAAAVALVAFMAVCLPAALANLHASGEAIPFTYNLGFNLFVGNNPEANGAYVDVTGGAMPVPLPGTSPVTGGALDGRAFALASEGLRLSPAASSAHWARKALAFVRSAPLRALALTGKKVLLLFDRRELPQIESATSFARVAGPLGLPLLGSYGFLAALGLAGLFWAVRGPAAERWLAGYVLLLSLALLPFFVTDRYRYHLVPALAVLAGLALRGIARALRGGTGAARIRAAIAVALAAGIVLAPVEAGPSGLGGWALESDLAMRLMERGAYAEAARTFARAETLLRESPPPRSTTARTAIASFYFRYGTTLEALGRPEAAIACWERAVALDPHDAVILARLALAYEIGNRPADAGRVRRALLAVPGGRGQLQVQDAWSAAGRGDLPAADRLFGEAIDAAPDLSLAWEGLIRVRIQAGRLEPATAALDQARCDGIDPIAAEIYECYLAVRRGDLVAARRSLERIPRGHVAADPTLARLLEDSRRALGGEVLPR